MLKIKVNGRKEYNIEISATGNSGKINNENFTVDVLKSNSNEYHIIRNNRSYRIEILKADSPEKSPVVKVNGRKYFLGVTDKFDELLKSLGMESGSAGKINEIKAPMPGLVLDILISPGQEVKKGDPIMVLEAMKMENILKSPSDGLVKKVNVEKKQAVEKNQVLVNFE